MPHVIIAHLDTLGRYCQSRNEFCIKDDGSSKVPANTSYRSDNMLW